MRVSVAKRLLTVKIVYYGPGLSGKTTNLRQLHPEFPPEYRGELLELDTESERTLFFDYFPAVLGRVGRFRIKVDFFTVPGQSFYHATRRAVLKGADGIVFVADSSEDREAANIQSREDLIAALAAMGQSLASIPHVWQWNKRDLADAMDPSWLEALLNPEGAPSVAAVATRNEGVWETQQLLLDQLLEVVKRRVDTGEAQLA
ncbi:MAG TPA: gliding-motility protein MglA [Deltaproteobacteria bacterium]|nr:gliding-motility protein MglA [Deltaproteobacteria bacterium]